MNKVKKLEREVKELSADELAHFRRWFNAFDASAWDRQLENDIAAGKLDALADAAPEDHARGKTTEL